MKYKGSNMLKYKLTNNKNAQGFYQIQALRDIPKFYVKAGDRGGFIEQESNLSHNGDAWVFDNAVVYGDARVYGDAKVFDNAVVYGDARVYGDAKVFDNAVVYGEAWVYGDAKVFDNAVVYGDARVCGNAGIYGEAWVYDNAVVYGDARVYGDAKVCGDAVIDSSSDIIYIQMKPYNITFTPQNIIIGCQNKTYKEWMKVKHKDTELDLKTFNKYKKILQFFNLEGKTK
jgi:carbonic anhydrase/acetyltransferase-like protein (isoleucine patch superfamily)